MATPAVKRKRMNARDKARIVRRVLLLRDQYRAAHEEASRLMSELFQSVRAGDTIDLDADDDHPARRITIVDPFIDVFGRPAPATRRVYVERFRLDAEEITSQGDDAHGQDGSQQHPAP